MRVATVSEMKGLKGAGAVSRLPREGTHIRKVYDLLVANKGAVVNANLHSGCSRAVDDLRDYYGLDIRRIRNGQWVLAGEWFGRVYVDYVAERFERGAA